MVPTGTPVYFYKSPHGATIMFIGPRGKTAKGKSYQAHEEAEKERGNLVTKQSQGKEVRLYYNSTSRNYLS